MTRSNNLSALLRWYPRSWRDRYGDELIALMEDTLGDEPPSPALRWSIARAGLGERARSGGWLGHSTPPDERVRAGALVVLCAWTALALAGAAFAKVSEHFRAALPPSSGTASVTAWQTVEIAAVIAAIAVLVGAVVAVPAFIRAWREGRCGDVRGHLVRALITTATTLVATAGIVAWARTLSASERENAAWPYALAFAGWAGLVALCAVSWSALLVGVARRVAFTRAELAVESALAGVVAISMIAIAVATTLWWRAVVTDAPWFLHGGSPGTSTSAIDVRLGAIITVMAAAVAAALYGVVRIAGSWTARSTSGC